MPWIHIMKKVQTISAPTRDALGIFAAMIRAARMQRGMTAAELGDSGEIKDTNTTIRNNSIYINTTSFDLVGIYALGGSTATSDLIASNLIKFGTSTINGKCFHRRTDMATYEGISHNICYRAAGVTWDNIHSTLAASQSAGVSASSFDSDPNLVANPSADPWSMAVQAGSIAINAGHPSKSSRRAIFGAVPVGARDIGSHDYGASTITPAMPTQGAVN